MARQNNKTNCYDYYTTIIIIISMCNYNGTGSCSELKSNSNQFYGEITSYVASDSEKGASAFLIYLLPSVHMYT